MAEKEKLAADVAEEEGEQDPEVAIAAAAKKKKLIVLGAVALVLLLLAGGGTWFALGFFGSKEESKQAVEGEKTEEKSAKHEEVAKADKKDSFYDALDPAFLANFLVGGRQHYLQLSLAVLARDENAIAGLHTHMPLIRNRIVMLLSGQAFDQLQTDAGRVQLQQALLAAIQEILTKETGKPGIEQVFFTNFVMQ